MRAPRRVRRVAAGTTVAFILAACGDIGEKPDDGGVAGDELRVDLAGTLSAEDAATAAAGINSFAFDLHTGVAEEGENTITSPLSASVFLAMVAAGAGGQNAEELEELLGLEGSRDTRYAALLADLVDTDDVSLSIANSLWAAEGYPFEEDYISFVQRTFGATLQEVDLGAQEAADAIDDWVEEHTEGLIDEIAADLDLPDAAAVLVLLDTVYFMGSWTTAFDPDDTHELPFTLASGEEVDVPTMQRGTAEVQASSGEGFQMLRLPYGEEGRFGMEILLPDDNLSLDELLQDLDADTWRAAVSDLQPPAFSGIALPRFELEWDAKLTDVLQSLGMISAFGDGDFTPMSPADPSLGAVVQKTYIRVDEEGTEAAAVTGGTMVTSAGPPPLHVDRPFAFTVSDSETGAVLFLGSVHDPRG